MQQPDIDASCLSQFYPNAQGLLSEVTPFATLKKQEKPTQSEKLFTIIMEVQQVIVEREIL